MPLPPKQVKIPSTTCSEDEMDRNKSHLVGQSSILANVSRDDGDEDAVMSTISHYRRQRHYSSAHAHDIAQCVVRHGAYDMVKGNILWGIME
jgi:hypothetical protein